jgi:cytochrome c oxidase subunit 2
MRVEREGTYYGECNQICGINHAFMPIEVKAVSKADFQTWLAQAKKAAGGAPREPAPERGPVLAAAPPPSSAASPAGNR